jgi:Zn-dependent M16 (insulinase) family peptidase
VAADDKLLPEMRDALEPIFEALRAGPVPGAAGGPDDFRAQPIRLGLAASVPVSFVARVFPCVSFTHPDTGGLLVLAKLLKAGYLHREIRERGGAYGGMAGYAPESGLFSLLSYRDPHLSRTVRVFDDAARWASGGGFDDREIKEAVLGVFSDLDTPLSPSGKAAREFGYLRQGLTRTMRQNLREQILATDRRRLQDLAQQHLVEGRARSSLAVVSNEEALKRANGELGEDALELQRV